jgi:hypothetical protein
VVGHEQRCANQLGQVDHRDNEHSTATEPGDTSTANDGLDVSMYIYGYRYRRDHEPFDADRAVVLASHQHKRADHEDANHARQRVDRAIPMRRVLRDDVDVERKGNEDQAGKNRRTASDHDEEVVPLVRSICIEREHPSPACVARDAYCPMHAERYCERYEPSSTRMRMRLLPLPLLSAFTATWLWGRPYEGMPWAHQSAATD